MKLSVRILLSFLLMLPVCLDAGAVAVEDVENVHVRDRSRYVTDMAGMLSPQAVTRLDSIMADIWRQSSAEPVTASRGCCPTPSAGGFLSGR